MLGLAAWAEKSASIKEHVTCRRHLVAGVTGFQKFRWFHWQCFQDQAANTGDRL